MVGNGRKWAKNMFIGQYNHNLDDKNRLTVPAKFRNALSGTFFATVGLDKCISIYTSKDFETYTQKLETLDTNDRNARQLQRYVASNTFELECDSHGRILLPDGLVKHSGIDKDVILVGSFDHIEIWAKEKWSAYEKSAESSFEDIAETLVK